MFGGRGSLYDEAGNYHCQYLTINIENYFLGSVSSGGQHIHVIIFPGTVCLSDIYR